MFSVEEVGGIPGVEGEGLKTLKGSKHGCGPLPPVPKNILHSKKAPASGIAAHGDGIPVFKIEVATAGVGKCVSPGELSLHTFRHSVGGAMELGFGRKRLADKTRIGCGFSMADVNRPVHR